MSFESPAIDLLSLWRFLDLTYFEYDFYIEAVKLNNLFGLNSYLRTMLKALVVPNIF